MGLPISQSHGRYVEDILGINTPDQYDQNTDISHADPNGDQSSRFSPKKLASLRFTRYGPISGPYHRHAHFKQQG